MVFPPFNLQSRMVFEDPPIVSSWQIWGVTIYESPKWNRGDTPLQIAAWYAPDTPGLIALLASAGADVSAAPGDESPLHAAISLGQAYASFELIAAGADVDAYDDQGATPLHLAVRFGKPALVRSLLEAGADPDVEDELGRTPRSMGQSHHDPAIRALLAAAPVPTSVGDGEPADRE